MTFNFSCFPLQLELSLPVTEFNKIKPRCLIPINYHSKDFFLFTNLEMKIFHETSDPSNGFNFGYEITSLHFSFKLDHYLSFSLVLSSSSF